MRRTPPKPRRSVARRSLSLVAVVATVGVLAPGAYLGTAAASGAPSHAVAAKKKPKKCKKNQVLRHGKCVAKSSKPVY